IIRSWIAPESHVIGPRDKEAYQAIKKIIAPYDGDTTAEAYQKATETVRNIHNIITKKITKILPRVYEDTQRGIQEDTLVKKMLQDDLDEFVEVLNLSDIQSLKQSAMIPGNYVNIPLESEELMNFE
ncbi:DrmE family protein, partial [uncultured Megasphaera sp.]